MAFDSELSRIRELLSSSELGRGSASRFQRGSALWPVLWVSSWAFELSVCARAGRLLVQSRESASIRAQVAPGVEP